MKPERGRRQKGRGDRQARGAGAGRNEALRTAATAAPFALAIVVFGTIYGAAASPLLGRWEALLSSAVIFSGALQFAVVGLLLGGASVPALLLTAVLLNLRHLLLGAALRPSLESPPLRRAGLAWWLIDETAGLALAAQRSPGLTLLVAGSMCYGAWVGGTALGVLGGSLASLRELAAAVFPVLFVGLAALAAQGRDLVVRALVAAVLTAGLSLAIPAARGVLPALVAVVVSLPEAKK